ncbi:hypothetical protein [Necropsobacter massiliensis]|nr:hypothetical protein [Necropsobacter massiliensis]
MRFILAEFPHKDSVGMFFADFLIYRQNSAPTAVSLWQTAFQFRVI